MNTFRLRIIMPDGEFYHGEVEYLSYQADDGRVGIMRGALPRVGVVAAGIISIRSAAVDERFSCGDGIIRITCSGVDMLVGECAAANDGDDE